MNQKQIKDFVIGFIKENVDESKSDEVLKAWNSKENSDKLKDVLKTKKKAKNEDKPKKTKSAYMFFCDENRGLIKEENEEISPTDIMKCLGDRWKVLKNSKDESDIIKLKAYNEQSLNDRIRFEQEMEKFQSNNDDNTSKVKPKTKLVKVSSPSKKTNGYIKFSKSNRDKYKEDNPSMSAQDITKLLSVAWKELSEEEKQNWKHSE